jgi:3-phytase
MRVVAAALGLILLSGCTTAPKGLALVAVPAVAETVPVGTSNRDAADDPSIWRNGTDPSASLIVATDKNAGLYVYGLDGRVRSFHNAGLVNNVDLLDMGDAGVIVVASDRNDIANAQLQIFRLNTQTAALDLLGKIAVASGEAYGLCLRRSDTDIIAFSILKDGTIHESHISIRAGQLNAKASRTFKIPTQTEGCVVDPRDGTLYVGEETAGIWRFVDGASTGTLVSAVDSRYLVADVEGLALVAEGNNGGYLLASSQGDNAFAVFRLPEMTPVGRFRISADAHGAVEETDGIDVKIGDLGDNFPEGLFIAQDGNNAPQAQNFKLVSWAAIKAALGL